MLLKDNLMLLQNRNSYMCTEVHSYVNVNSPLFVLRIQILNDLKNGPTENFVKEPNKAIYESTGSLQNNTDTVKPFSFQEFHIYECKTLIRRYDCHTVSLDFVQ